MDAARADSAAWGMYTPTASPASAGVATICCCSVLLTPVGVATAGAAGAAAVAVLLLLVVVVVLVVASGIVAVVTCLAAVGLARGLMEAAALPNADAARCRQRHAVVRNRCHHSAAQRRVTHTAVVAKQLEQPALTMSAAQPWRIASRMNNICHLKEHSRQC
jgi:hypothetical protein